MENEFAIIIDEDNQSLRTKIYVKLRDLGITWRLNEPIKPYSKKDRYLTTILFYVNFEDSTLLYDAIDGDYKSTLREEPFAEVIDLRKKDKTPLKLYKR